MDSGLAGRVCLITGGAQGVGWAIARAMAAQGVRVYACDISSDNIARAAAELAASARDLAITLDRCDVADRAAVEQWVARVHQGEGRVDVLVNNAAYARWADLLDLAPEDDVRMMRVGYEGMVYGTRAVLPLMLQAGYGRIVNMGSSAGRVFAGASSAAYAATKAAIEGYTQTLQAELRNTPVHLTLVRPAAIAGTDFFRKHIPSKRMPRILDFLTPTLQPEQVADAIVQAVRNRRNIVDLPWYLPLFYGLFLYAPGLARLLMSAGQGSRRDYAQVAHVPAHDDAPAKATVSTGH
jgi:NAD(P)-dependent dehydrogenase (short-subunit alcohol dehydrogenase family)